MDKSSTRIGLLNGNDSCKMRIIVNGKHLIIQEMCEDNDNEPYLTNNSYTNGYDEHEMAKQECVTTRTVELRRNSSVGLGLSIKGGSEHSLPILISRIVTDSPADISRQLFVGDEIIAVNGTDISNVVSHDRALQLLRECGERVTLRVRHHKASTILRKWWKKDDIVDIEKDNPLIKKSNINNSYKYLNNRNTGTNNSKTKSLKSFNNSWKECVQMELFLSYVSRYVSYSDKLRDAGFEIRSINGQSVVVQCDNEDICHQWCQTIINAINNLTENHIKLINSILPVTEHIHFMGWISECSSATTNAPKLSYKWSHQYLIIKGGSIYMLKSPPLSLVENNSQQLTHTLMTQSLHHFRCYQSVFRCVPANELLDDRRHCFIIQSADELSLKYFSLETAEDLAAIKTSWHKANYYSVTQLGSKTFPVICDGKSGSLTLDWRMGFALYDPLLKEYKWNYKFHQLKHSSDDGQCKLSLTFVIDPNDSRVVESQLLECNSMQNLLYCMHAFLSAKVASVDPRFLQSSYN